MTEEGIMELIDRLVATNSRAAIAERELEAAKCALKKDIEEIDALKAKISELEDEVKSQNEIKLYWYDKHQKLEKELKALKEAESDGGTV